MKNIIKTFTSDEFKSVNGFVVANDETKKAVIIDTAFKMIEEMAAYIEDHHYEVVAIILSHGHFDHFVGIDELAAKYDKADVYITLDSLPALFDPVLNFSSFYNTKYGTYVAKQPKRLKALMYDKDYDLDGIKFRVLKEGGHAKGSVMLDFYEDKVLFSGSVLVGSRADKMMPEIADDNKKIEDNIRRILTTFDASYNLYPGHQNVKINVGDILKYNIHIQRILAMS